jgi:aspartate aminotransferase
VKALRDGEHGYTDATGIAPLREAVAEDLHRRAGVEVSPDDVLIVPGGKVTMFMAIMMFGEKGADIVYPDPGFPIYRSMIEFSGARPIPLPMREANGFAFSAEEALKLMTPETRLVILNSPANPTGGVTPKEEIDSLGRDLRAIDLRRPRASLAFVLSRDPRSAHPARRLVEDLRHDRVAARLFRMA